MSKMVCLAGSGRAKRGLAMVPKWRTNKKREERCGARECQKWTCNESDQREEQYCGAQKTLHHTKKWWLLGAFLWDLRPQYASNKGLVRSFNSLWNSSKKDSPTIAPTLRHDWLGMQKVAFEFLSQAHAFGPSYSYFHCFLFIQPRATP